MTRRIVVAVDEVDADAARLEPLSLQLREELLSHRGRRRHASHDGRSSVRHPRPGACRGGCAHRLPRQLRGGALPGRGDRAAMARSRQRRTPVELTIGDRHLRLTGASAEEQTRLINAFLEAAEP